MQWLAHISAGVFSMMLSLGKVFRSGYLLQDGTGGRTMDDLISRAALLKECAECQKTDPRFEERGWANHFINEAGEPSTE